MNVAYRWFCRLDLSVRSRITERFPSTGTGAFATANCCATCLIRQSRVVSPMVWSGVNAWRSTLACSTDRQSIAQQCPEREQVRSQHRSKRTGSRIPPLLWTYPENVLNFKGVTITYYNDFCILPDRRFQRHGPAAHPYDRNVFSPSFREDERHAVRPYVGAFRGRHRLRR